SGDRASQALVDSTRRRRRLPSRAAQSPPVLRRQETEAETHRPTLSWWNWWVRGVLVFAFAESLGLLLLLGLRHPLGSGICYGRKRRSEVAMVQMPVVFY
ncbi:hypothetical protein U9M48_039470, partial [Paspalum notatum var. saurae]